MVQVQDAVKSSFSILGQVFPSGDVREPRLEEVALSEDEGFWLVTVSFSNPDYAQEQKAPSVADDLNSLLWRLNTPRRRVNKTIKIRANDGAFVGIKDQWES